MHPVFHLFSISILFMFTNISLAATDDAVHALLKDIDFNAYPSGLGFTDAPKPTIDIDNDNILSIRIPVTPARNRMIKNSETMGGMTNGFSLVGGNAFDNTWSVGADDLVGLSIGAKLDQTATYSDARDMIHLNSNGSLFFDATLMKE